MTRLCYGRHFEVFIDDDPDEKFEVRFVDGQELLRLATFDAASFKEFIIEMLSYLPPARKYDVQEEDE